MSNKFSVVCMVSLLLFLTVSHSLARSMAAFHDVTPMETPNHPEEKQQVIPNTELEGCEEGVGDEEEECMMRRTLQAHLDYIYTQKEKQP